jgi:hypothetical protein
MTNKIINPDKEFIKRRDNAIKNSIEVTISDESYQMLLMLSKIAAENKLQAGQKYVSVLDGDALETRTLTGMVIEMAWEQHLNTKFLDLTTAFDLKKDRPDMEDLGIDVGIKGTQFKYPTIINTTTLYPQLLGIGDETNLQKVYLLGLFGVTLLNNLEWRDDSLKKTKQLYEKKSKAAFYALDAGIKINSLEHLINTVGDKWLTKNRKKYDRVVTMKEYYNQQKLKI